MGRLSSTSLLNLDFVYVGEMIGLVAVARCEVGDMIDAVVEWPVDAELSVGYLLDSYFCLLHVLRCCFHIEKLCFFLCRSSVVLSVGWTFSYFLISKHYGQPNITTRRVCSS